MPGAKRDVRAWVQARVDEAGGIDRARPAGITQKAWREVCVHHGVTSRPRKANTLEDALRAVADLAKP